MFKFHVCCDVCFERIAKKNTVSARIWMDLIRLMVEYESPMFTLNSDFYELKILEKLGFIVTTDLPDSIIIRVNGRSFHENGVDYFCLRDDSHG